MRKCCGFFAEMEYIMGASEAMSESKKVPLMMESAGLFCVHWRWSSCESEKNINEITNCPRPRIIRARMASSWKAFRVGESGKLNKGGVNVRRKRNGMRVPSREELLEERERKRKEFERLMSSENTYRRKHGGALIQNRHKSE